MRNNVSGWHKVRETLDVLWIYKQEVRILRDGVRLDLFVHDCRNGGDGYTRLENLHLISYATLYQKLIQAVDEGNPRYVLREAVA